MMNAKEYATVRTQAEARDAAMKSARHWAEVVATPERQHYAKKTYVKFVKDAVKNARKASRKIVAAKAAGTARPVSLVLATVLPLMETMAKDAGDRALAHVAEVRAKVAAEGLDVAYPEAARLSGNDRWNRQLIAKTERQNARRRFAAMITGENAEEFVTNYIESEVFSAQQQFRAFAAKLEHKVGAITEAKLQVLNGVWGESYLYVTTAEGVAQCWKTQTIVNRSVLDNLFYQWPTRTIKM
jgi:hypothetical protein